MRDLRARRENRADAASAGDDGEDNPDSWESACIDDLCHGGEVPCMHGDYARLPCSMCGK